MKKFILLLTLTTALTFAFAQQDPRTWLAARLRAADTVVLVSHETPAQMQMARREPGTPPPEYGSQLLLNGRPNPRIIKEQRGITGPALDTLINILTKAYADDAPGFSLCFAPHHTIFLIKDGVVSFIDLCFHCLNFGASADLGPLQGKNFSRRKWADLRQYFISQGFRYALQ